MAEKSVDSLADGLAVASAVHSIARWVEHLAVSSVEK